MKIKDAKTIYKKRSQYQVIEVVEDYRGLGRMLLLDGVVQCTTYDWYRYHEALAAIPYLFTRFAKNVAILGGGDGYAAKVLLEHFPVESITIVDLDPEVVEVSRALLDFPYDDRITVVHEDAGAWIKSSGPHDLVLADYTDPTFPACAMLYTREHLQDIKDSLEDGGVFATQMAAPFSSPKACACLIKTMATVFPNWFVAPYRVHLPCTPSPGQNGFCLASQYPMQLRPQGQFRWLNHGNLQSAFWLDNDEVYPMDGVEVSTRDNVLYSRLYQTSYKREVEEWEEEAV